MCPPLFAAMFTGLSTAFGGGAAAGAGAAAAGTAAASGASGLGTLGTLAGLAGAGLQAVGSIQAANAQAAGLEAQAAFNERQAELERERGRFEATRESERAQRLFARQRANFLASGVALEGSPTAVIEDTAADTALDIAAIRYGSNLRASNFQFQAGMDRMNASSARAAGPIGAISAGLSGITRLRSPFQIA